MDAVHAHAHGPGPFCRPVAVIVPRVPAQSAAAQENHSEPPSGRRTRPGVRGWVAPPASLAVTSPCLSSSKNTHCSCFERGMDVTAP